MTTERTLTYSGLTGEGFFALDYDLSRINHRLYRQSKCYYGRVDLNQINSGDEVEIYTIADTWFNRKAYMHAMEIYFKSRAGELETAGSSKARWGDFRVHPGKTFGVAPGTWNNPIDPVQYDGDFVSGAFTAGQYLYSRMPDSSFNMEGFSWGSVGPHLVNTHVPFTDAWNVITEFEKADNVQATPENLTIDQPYANTQILSSEGASSAEYDDVARDGNEPPYNADDMPSRVFVQRATLGSPSASGSDRLTTGLIPIPCGIVLYKVTSGSVNLNVTMKKGQYKGVHTEDWGTPKLVNGKEWKVM